MNLEELEKIDSYEYLEQLGTEELETLLQKLNADISYLDTYQMALKILMNSLYGALANKYFPLFNDKIASAITANGRYFIRNLGSYFNKSFNEILNSNQEFRVYGDTDSCVFDTIVKINGNEIKIGELYNQVKSIEEHNGRTFAKPCEDLITPSFNKELQCVEYKPIKYIMKHKVKKRMFTIRAEGKEITITNDHSVIVMRDNCVVEIKPSEIQKGDKLIMLKD